MARINAAAVIRAIEQLRALDLGPREESLVEVFLTGRRFQTLGFLPTTSKVDEVVRDLFVVLPNHPYGRLQPFATPRLGGQDRRRGWIANSKDTGRSTVWNAGTRGHAKQLCVNNHFGGGLAKDAVDKLKTALGGKAIPREALITFLVRHHEFGGPIDMLAAEGAFADTFSSSSLQDLSTLTTGSITLGIPLDGSPEWSPDRLPPELGPPASPDLDPDDGSGTVVPVSINVDPRVRKMVERAIASSRAVLLVGPPGTGKSTLLHEVSSDACANPANFDLGEGSLPPPTWITAEEGWTARDLVGGESIVGGEVKFRPGHLLRAIHGKRWLVIDELNRADMDRIFGPIFTWLAGGDPPPVSLGKRSAAPNEPEIELAWSGGRDCTVDNEALLDSDGGAGGEKIRFCAGKSWRLLGTYNAVDAQRVFRVGQALGRRFLRVPIPPATVDEFDDAIQAASDLDETTRGRIVSLYGAHRALPETTLGPALFLRIADYVMTAARLAMSAGEDVAEATASAFVEGYLINVGAYFALLDTDQVEALGARLKGAGALDDADWGWVNSMAQNFR